MRVLARVSPFPRLVCVRATHRVAELTRPLPWTDYEEDVIDVPASTTATTAASTLDDAVAADSKDQKGSYVGVHSTGFRDFLLKPELLRAISDMGFEHPSEVQQECIPQAILGMDVLCQAKSGMGKSTPPSRPSLFSGVRVRKGDRN